MYTITLSESADNPYLESGSYTRKIGTRFEDFFPYSKFSDELDSQNYGTIQNYEKRGQYFFTDEYSTSIPTLFGKVNQPIQIQVRITDQSDITKVRHLSFYTDVRGNTSDKQFSNAYVIFEKGKDITVFDSNGIFKDVKVSSLIENDQFWVILDFTFNKPMEKSDILLETWNEGRKPVYAKIVNTWEISELKHVEKQEEIPLNAQVEITHDAASPICSGDNTCYDPFEAKITIGGTVTWINTDSFIHTVTNGVPEKGEDQPHLFEGYVSSGRSYQYTFNKAGSYPFFCEIHPWAIGLVSVYDENFTSTNPSSAHEHSLIVTSVTSQGSLLIHNDDAVYLKDRSLKIKIQGHIEGATHGKSVDLLIKRPDRSFEKIKVVTNNKGYYETLTVLDKKWQSGSYTIVAQYQKNIVGNISFVIMESR